MLWCLRAGKVDGISGRSMRASAVLARPAGGSARLAGAAVSSVRATAVYPAMGPGPAAWQGAMLSDRRGAQATWFRAGHTGRAGPSAGVRQQA